MRPDRTPFVAAHLGSAHRIAADGMSVEAARMAHLDFALSTALLDVAQTVACRRGMRALFMEFGVRDGRSVGHLANRTAATWPSARPDHGTLPIAWHGFDSFRGLPRGEAAAGRVGWRAHMYTTRGRLPRVPAAVSLHPGWFNDTVPAFLDGDGRGDPVCFAHIDCDLYESTVVVLTALASRCQLCAGAVLSFDELFGSPAVEALEWRALNEVAARWGLGFRFISYMAHARSAFGRAAIQIVTHSRSRCCVRAPG